MTADQEAALVEEMLKVHAMSLHVECKLPAEAMRAALAVARKHFADMAAAIGNECIDDQAARAAYAVESAIWETTP